MKLRQFQQDIPRVRQRRSRQWRGLYSLYWECQVVEDLKDSDEKRKVPRSFYVHSSLEPQNNMLLNSKPTGRWYITDSDYMKKIIKALTRITMYCMIPLALYPYDSIAQPSNSHNGEVLYYRTTTPNEYGYNVYAIMFMDGYLVSYSIHSSENIFLQSKKNNDINGLKSYLLQKLNNKTDRMQFLMTNSNGEPVYGDESYHWTFTKDYSKFSEFNEEAMYYGVNPFDEFSKIELKDIIKY